MQLHPLDFLGLDVPVPVAVATPEADAPLAAVRFTLPLVAQNGYLAALEAWARASKFRLVAQRDVGTVHLRRYERDAYRVVLHLGIDEASGSLVARGPGTTRTPYVAATWEGTLEASTDLEVAMLEATTNLDDPAASRGIEARLGLAPTALDAFDPAQARPEPAAATIEEGVLREKSRLALPAGSTDAAVVTVDGARHYTIRSTARLSAASLRKHYRAWAKEKGYDILGDVYDGEILELTLRRRTRGLVVAWARGNDHTTVQIGPARQVLARRQLMPAAPAAVG